MTPVSVWAYFTPYFQLVNIYFPCDNSGMKWKPLVLNVPDFSGLYRIALDGKLAYIGQAEMVFKRLSGHGILPGGACDKFGLFKGIPFETLEIKTYEITCKLKRLRVERRLIGILKPPACIAGNPDNAGKAVSNMATNAHFRKFVRMVGSQADASRLLKISPGHISLMYNGKRPVTIDLASRIEIATNGKISRESLVFPQRRIKQPTEAA